MRRTILVRRISLGFINRWGFREGGPERCSCPLARQLGGRNARILSCLPLVTLQRLIRESKILGHTLPLIRREIAD